MKLNSNKNNNNDNNPFLEVNDNDFLSTENNQISGNMGVQNSFDNQQSFENFDNGTPMNQYNQIPNNQKPKKKKSSLFLIIFGVICILLAVVFLFLGGKGEDKPVVEKPPIEQKESENKGTEEEPIVDNPEVDEPIVDDPEVDEPIVEDPEVDSPDEKNDDEPNMGDSNILAFEDSMVGIKFNFDSDLYIKKNVEEIFTKVKAAIPEGRTTFNIFTDKLNETMNVCKLTTGKQEGLYINVSVIPFELERAKITRKVDGTTVLENETIGSVDINTEELIKNYDKQIRETVEGKGCTIMEYGESTVIEVGKIEKTGAKLQGIFTSRIYSGPEQETSSTGVVDVVQCTIPLGKNAILITAVTDGRPIEIDKSYLVNEIAESFVVIAEPPVEEVTEETTEKAE